MAVRTPTPDGLAIAPNAPATANDPAASDQELQVNRSWGRWELATQLPNASGNAAASPSYDQMRPGDEAYVLGSGVYVLSDRGTSGGADAVWVLQASTASVNHFAPTIIVGNTVAGDPAPNQPAPFRYISDPGDGSGIATAFTEAAALGTGALVHIRRGLYDFGLPGSPALPLAVAGFRVTGDGSSTILRLSTLDRRLLLLSTAPTGNNRPPELASFMVDYTVAVAGAVGTEMIDALGSFRAKIYDIEVVKNATGAAVSPALNADESLTSIFRAGFATRLAQCNLVSIDGTAGLTVVGYRFAAGSGSCDQCHVIGTNVGFRVDAGAHVQQLSACRTLGSVIAGSHNGVEIAALATRIDACHLASGVDGLVAESGSSVIVDGNNVTAMSGDGIRIEAGALSSIVTANRMNGETINVLEPTTVVGLNAL